jgi:hypothetical protein
MLMFIAVGHHVGVAIQEIMTGKRSHKEAMDACNADVVDIVKRAGGKISEADLIKSRYCAAEGECHRQHRRTGG